MDIVNLIVTFEDELGIGISDRAIKDLRRLWQLKETDNPIGISYEFIQYSPSAKTNFA